MCFTALLFNIIDIHVCLSRKQQQKKTKHTHKSSHGFSMPRMMTYAVSMGMSKPCPMSVVTR